MSKLIVTTTELISAFRANLIEGMLPENCWLWIGGTNGDNYGQLWHDNCLYAAHRLAYAIYRGALDRQLVVMHTCDNPLCVNPAHLLQGTNAQNSADMVQKNRQARGDNFCCSKLREADIPVIRFKAALGMTERALATEYKVTQPTIHEVLSRKTWRHVP